MDKHSMVITVNSWDEPLAVFSYSVIAPEVRLIDTSMHSASRH